MKKLLVLLMLISASATLFSNKSFAQIAPATTLLSGIDDDSNFYKFASLVRSAGMDAELAALGTYTVFAPHNTFFRNMSPGKTDSLMHIPDLLKTVLKAHIVKGKITKAEILKKLTAGKGKATLTNLLGQPLKLAIGKGNVLTLTDNKGNKAEFATFDIKDPKAVIHGIDNVLYIGK